MSQRNISTIAADNPVTSTTTASADSASSQKITTTSAVGVSTQQTTVTSKVESRLKSSMDTGACKGELESLPANDRQEATPLTKMNEW